MKKLIIYISLVFVLGSSFAHAVGLSVSPKELKVNVDAKDSSVYKLKVKNPSSQVAIFEAYPDDFRSVIKTSPASFILETGESREISIEINPKESGIFRTNISITATPIAKSAFNAGSGIKIPLEITVAENQSWYLAKISAIPLTYSRILGISLLILIVGISFMVVRYAIKQIKI